MTSILTEAPLGEPGRSEAITPEAAIEARTPWELAWARLRKDKVSLISVGIIVALALIALITTFWHPPFLKQPNAVAGDGLTVDGIPKGPSSKYLLGNDDIGRDILSRVVYGSQVSLFVGIVATGLSLLIGVTVGLIAGYFGKWVDSILQFLVDVVLSLPLILFALALAAVFGQSLRVTIGVITFFSWPSMARIVRGQVLSLREKEFVEAARSLGASDLRIVFVDVLPNLVAPIIIYSTLILPINVLSEAALSFLGIGVPAPTATWGNMLSSSITWVNAGVWWFFTFPGLALLTLVLAFNLLGDGLRDALDPRAGRTMAKR